MSKLDDIERLARTSERLTILTPFTTLQLVDAIRAYQAWERTVQELRSTELSAALADLEREP